MSLNSLPKKRNKKPIKVLRINEKEIVFIALNENKARVKIIFIDIGSIANTIPLNDLTVISSDLISKDPIVY